MLKQNPLLLNLVAVQNIHQSSFKSIACRKPPLGMIGNFLPHLRFKILNMVLA
ncbi:hypothetical protein OIU76_014914 [Salix suchowensis]|nr:hypothetical protein OIU76_014914 [Salix suchowensis]